MYLLSLLTFFLILHSSYVRAEQLDSVPAQSGAEFFFVGQTVLKDGDSESALALFSKGCQLKDGESCAWLGKLAEETKHNLVGAKAAYEQACNREVGWGCERLLRFTNSEVETKRLQDKAARLYKYSCKIDKDAWFCERLAQLTQKAGQKENSQSSFSDAELIYRNHCAAGSEIACQRLTLRLEEAGDYKMDAELKFWHNACDEKNVSACSKLADLSVSERTEISRELYNNACHDGDSSACVSLGELLIDKGDFDQAETILAVACARNHFTACSRLEDTANIKTLEGQRVIFMDNAEGRVHPKTIELIKNYNKLHGQESFNSQLEKYLEEKAADSFKKNKFFLR